MQKILLAVLAGAFILAAQACTGHDEKAADTYIHATYFDCDSQEEVAADESFERHTKPVYQKAMEKGLITGWGYLKHLSGSPWRRVAYHMGSSVNDVINAGNEMARTSVDEMTGADDAFSSACHVHDEYIWKVANGNQSDEPGNAGVSVYMNCTEGQEQRADEIITANFAPIYNVHLGEDKLASWRWATQVQGGAWNRQLTMTAQNVETLLAMRASILNSAPDMPEGIEFVKICGVHQFYIWTDEEPARQGA